MASKVRPYITLPELSIIIASLRQTASSPILLHYLEGFETKTELGIIQPALVTKPTITERLELDYPVRAPGDMAQSLGSLGEQKLAAYNKWISDFAKCSAQEIARASMYRYENDLMTTEEESRYEQSQHIS